MRILKSAALLALLASCGVVYNSPTVREGTVDDTKVRVVPITAESLLAANRSTYDPKTLPAVFSMTAGVGSPRGAGAIPEPAYQAEGRPASLETRLPPPVADAPYRIGIGDVLLLATPQATDTVSELTGLLAAQSRRQGYTVQDDGAIAIPDVGRVPVAGLTLEEAEAAVFQQLVGAQIDPSFSLEIAEFNSKTVSVGGAVNTPVVAPITLTPLYLDTALAAAGGVKVSDLDYATIRLYRDGTLYQIPLSDMLAQPRLQKIRLLDGDSIYVDTAYDLDKAEAFFSEQIRLAEYRQTARTAALNQLETEITLRRAELEEARDTYSAKLDLDSVDRDYVYLTGEVSKQGRYPLPFEHKAHLADAIYGGGSGLPNSTANARQIYVLRGSTDPREFGSITAWQLDATNATNLLLATRFELRPDDVIFVAEQPVTRWNRVVNQISPAIITVTANAADPSN